MPQDLVPLTTWAPVAGLRSDLPKTLIPDAACSACNDVVGFEGRLRPRAGFTANAALPDLGGTLAAYHLTGRQPLTGAGETLALARDTGTNAVTAWELGGGPAWTNRTGAAVLTGSVDVHPSSCSFKGVLYLTTAAQGANDHLYRWVGTATNLVEVTNGTAAIAPYQKPKFVYAWDGRLWMFHYYDQTASVYLPYGAAWGDLNIDNVWQGGINGGSSGYQPLIDGREDDTTPITGVIDTRDAILGFKADSIYAGAAAAYPDFYRFYRIFRGVGTVSHGSLARYMESILFLGDDNVWQIEGQQKRPLASTIRTRLRAAVQTSNLQRTVGIVDPYNELYWLIMPKITTSAMSKLFIFSLRDGAWWEGEIQNANIRGTCTFSSRSGPWARTLVVGSTDGGFYNIDTAATTDAGSVFTPSWTGKIFDSVQVSQGKTEILEIQRITVHADSGKITASVRDGPNLHEMTTKQIGTLIYDGKHGNFIGARRTGRFLEMTLTWDMTDPCVVQGYTTHALSRGGPVPYGNRSGSVA